MSNDSGHVEVGPAIARMKEQFAATSDQLIPMLQHLQNEMGYLPSEGLTAIADYLKVPPSHVYGVATFYAQFRFKPLGKNRITVCRGTACHVRGSQRLVEELEREMKIKAGDTTPDLQFSLQTVACLGSCALAPVVVVNDKVYGKMTSKATKKIIAQLNGGKPAAPAPKLAPDPAVAEVKKPAPEKAAAPAPPAPVVAAAPPKQEAVKAAPSKKAAPIKPAAKKAAAKKPTAKKPVAKKSASKKPAKKKSAAARRKK